MLRVVQDLEGLTVEANGREIGKTHDLLLNELNWKIFSLVVNYERDGEIKRILISPQNVREILTKEKKCRVNVSEEDIENADNSSEIKYAVDQTDAEFSKHLSETNYFTLDPHLRVKGDMIYDNKFFDNKNLSHIRSLAEIRNYSIIAKEEYAGYVHSFIVDTKDWILKYIVVNKEKWMHWLPHEKHVLISPEIITEINKNNSTVSLIIEKSALENNPEYKPGEIIDERYS